MSSRPTPLSAPPPHPNTNQTPNPTSPPPNPPPQQRTTWLVQRSTWGSQTRFWAKPFIGILIYALTLSIAATATHRYTILGRVSASNGTAILTILSKAGDIAFGIAVADVCDSIAWRKLAREWDVPRATSFSGVPLLWFLSLLSSTGVEGLFRIVWVSLDDWVVRSRAGRWSFLRLVMILVLIPGPGIVLMANVEQKEVFFPTESVNVTGGLGIYDPGIATAYNRILGTFVAGLTQNMLQDRAITWKLNPISGTCRATKSCRSFLIAGPYLTVAPWPFELRNDGEDWFKLEDAPFYQVDLWDTPEDLAFSFSRDCTLYGGINRTSTPSIALCIAQPHAVPFLQTGWVICQGGRSPNGTCLEPGSANWSSSIQFYRRKATVVFSRTDRTIEQVSSLSEPQTQNISSASLFESIDTYLYQPSNLTFDSYFDTKSLPYMLTQHIGSHLTISRLDRVRSLSSAKDWLINVVILPVLLFTPTIVPLTPFDMGGNTPQSALLDENHLKGSYCYANRRAIPGKATVIGYGVVAGVVILFIVIGKLIASWWPRRDTTEFPMLDFEALTMLRNSNKLHGEDVSLRDRFQTGGYEEGALVKEVADLWIGLRIT